MFVTNITYHTVTPQQLVFTSANLTRGLSIRLEVPALRLRLGRDDKIDETNPRPLNLPYSKPVPITWTMLRTLASL